MLLDTIHAALENTEIAFDRVRMNVTARPFINFMLYAFVTHKPRRAVVAAFVGHHRGFFRDVGLDDGNDMGGAGAIGMKRANLPALAIDKRQHSILVAVATPLDRAFLAANE